MATTFPAAVTAAQTGPGRAEVLDQVARLVDLEESAIEQMRAEALGAPTRGVVAYGEYQSGGWWTTSLMNHSGDPHDVVIGDGRPQPTSLLGEMPATARARVPDAGSAGPDHSGRSRICRTGDLANTLSPVRAIWESHDK
ncbi:hypothetical protein ADL00_11565 [Streptomyces sp. AS58]|uniref:hypothetical protein n=1 Tax=Streptomyces sp. AS58 TaxID=1519489 RepID=UPI0006ADD5D0|nr:hypothetical protein [Streptomyces sp. AS58]KOV69427.1 hypothetical protein ADL00_11565 [Streptomyces sp. AS58]